MLDSKRNFGFTLARARVLGLEGSVQKVLFDE